MGTQAVRFLLAVLTAAAPFGVAQETELLRRPLLEVDGTGRVPEPWGFRAWETGSQPLVDPTGGPDGRGAAGVACLDAQDRGCWVQTVALGGVCHLRLHVLYRTENGLRDGGALVRLAWRDAGRAFIANTRLRLPSAPAWTEAEEVVAAPAGAEHVEVELFNEYRPGRVWWARAGLRAATRVELLRFDERPAAEGEWGFRPDHGETSSVNPPSFVWRPQHAAPSYVLQVAGDDAFAGIVHEAEVPEYTAHCPPRPFDAGQYWWRVRSCDTEGLLSAWSSARRFSVPPGAVHFPLPERKDLFSRLPQGHPRLFIRPEELPRLRELARGPLGDHYAALVSLCDRLVASPPPLADYTKYPEGMQRLSPEWARIWRGARSYVERPLDGASLLALVWLLGGNETYAQAAREILLQVAEWDPFGATGYRYNDEAGMRYAYGFSRAYTLVHPLLSEGERERCRAVMRARGDEMYGHLHRQRQHLWNPYSSHPNRAYHFLGEIGLAFYGEIPEAEEWAWFAMNVFQNVYPVWSDSDGGWHEGASYWVGYMTLVTWWLDIMRATLGHDGYRKPFFAQAGYFPIYAQPPHVPRLSFGDTTGVRTPADVRPLMTLLVQQTGNPYWADYLDRLGGPVEARHAVGFIRAARVPDRARVKPRSIGELPPSRLFAGTGLAYLHTNLTDARENVQVSFKSSPFGSESHGNEAQNSFELYAYGDALLVRSGTREIHGSPHHRNWTWQTHSCNAITINGQGQMPHTPTAHGRIRRFASAAAFDYLVGDAAAAYPGGLVQRADRHVLFVKPHLVLIWDDIETPEPATVQFHLHSPHPLVAGVEGSLHVVGERAQCRIDLLVPDPVALTLSEGFDPPIRPPFDQQIREFHAQADAPTARTRQPVVASIHVGRSGDSLPSGRGTVLHLPAGLGVRIPLPEGEVLALLRSGRGKLSAWGLTCQGAVAAVRQYAGGAPGRVFTAGDDTAPPLLD